MTLEIRHETRYLFDDPVRLQPHFIRMNPLCYPGTHVGMVDIQVSPAPAGSAWIVDESGNKTLHVWFLGETRQLDIMSHIQVKNSRNHPFDFLFYPLNADQISFYPGHSWSGSLFPFLVTESLPPDAGEWLTSLTQPLTVTFLQDLCRGISERFRFHNRESGLAWTAARTWQEQSGACRDLSWLMIQLLRSMNLPARFVSGYHFAPGQEDHELHAWVEVFLPGGGWVGLDPSSGLAVDDHYVPVATGHEPSMTLPVTGSYLGTASASLNTSVTFVEQDDL